MIYFFGETAGKDTETKASEVQAVSVPRTGGSCTTTGHGLNSHLGPKDSPRYRPGRQNMKGSSMLCVSYRVGLPSKMSQIFLCFSYQWTSLIQDFILEKRRKFTKCQVYARCFIYFISILPITLGDRDCILKN